MFSVLGPSIGSKPRISIPRFQTLRVRHHAPRERSAEGEGALGGGIMFVFVEDHLVVDEREAISRLILLGASLGDREAE